MLKQIIAVGLIVTALQANSTEQEVFDHLRRRGQTEFDVMTKKYGCHSGGDWKNTIGHVFARIMKASGRTDNLTLCVIKREGFNAGAIVSGQFVIHADALTVFGNVAKQHSQNDPVKEQAIRELLLAGIAGHELAHYYNQHAFKKYQKIFAVKKSDSETEKFLSQLAYSREMEFDADRSGHMLLQAAGFNADLAMTLAFEIMRSLDPQGSNKHHFLETHPNVRERLAQFNSQNQDWYRETAELEKAFADVNSGVNLSKANAAVAKASVKYPENLFLLQVLAVGRHKRWLDTVALKDQKLRVILDTPAFTDQMLESKRGSRGAKKIPGDSALYHAATREYAKLAAAGMSAPVKANYAVLLAYSDDENDIKHAEEYARAAAKESPQSAQTINNLAVTLFISGKEKEAVQLLADVSKVIEQMYREAKAEEFSSWVRIMSENQLVDKGYIVPNMTVILNYALALSYTNKKDESKSVALQYLELYDNNSTWARRLAKLNDSEDKVAKKVERNYIAVNGVKVGSGVADLVEKWKSEKKIGKGSAEGEVWLYPEIMTKVYVDALITRIDLSGDKAPRLPGGAGIGSTRVALEKLLGQPSSLRNGYYVYNGAQPAAVLYQNGKAAEIVLLMG